MSEIYVTEDISKEIDSISNEVLRSESVNVDGTEFTVNWHKLPVYEGSGNDRKVTCFVETPVILDVSTVIDKWFSDNDSGLEVRKLVNSKLASVAKSTVDGETLPEVDTVMELAERVFKRDLTMLSGVGMNTAEKSDQFSKFLFSVIKENPESIGDLMEINFKWVNLLNGNASAKDKRNFIEKAKKVLK